MSERGNCRTLSERIAWSPAIRITRFTTSASTGRRTKRSVSFMLAVLRLGGGVVPGLHLVVDDDGGAGAELEHARAHDFLPGLDAGDDGDLVAAPVAELHEALLDAAIGLAGGPFEVAHHEHRVAVGRVADRRGRKRDQRLAGAGRGLHLDEHPGAQ